MKKCLDCKADKDVAEFYRNRNHKDGRDGLCKECRKARTRQYSKSNPGYFTEYSRKRRAGLKNGTWEPNKYNTYADA